MHAKNGVEKNSKNWKILAQSIKTLGKKAKNGKNVNCNNNYISFFIVS